jgi:hypothetical protein
LQSAIVFIHLTEWTGGALRGTPRQAGVTRSKGARSASFPAHPIADPFFDWIIVTSFAGERRFTHVWTPTTAEAVRDAVLYNGPCFLEAFRFGLDLGTLARILFARLTRSTIA